MATTTNFGWETPDDTDLVKDGALAIRTLGNSIDTSLVDLKGGTTGQVLSKTSNTDMDFTWVAQDDSNAIQNAIVDAKGDLITATAADTPARLAVGTNGQILTADSTTATGLKWASASSPSFVGCSVYKTTTQSISNTTETKITWDAEIVDTNGFHDNSTNNTRFTVPSGYAGKYLFVINVNSASNSATDQHISLMVNNATRKTEMFASPTAGPRRSILASMLFDLAVGDYLEVNTYQNSGGSVNLNGGNTSAQRCQADFIYLGA